MKQIKTIFAGTPEAFDEAVNNALKEGWKIRRIGRGDVGFTADLYKNEKTCTDCRHQHSDPYKEPCSKCNEEYDKWSPIPEEPPCETN